MYLLAGKKVRGGRGKDARAIKKLKKILVAA
jgi:hypothetical protein